MKRQLFFLVFILIIILLSFCTSRVTNKEKHGDSTYLSINRTKIIQSDSIKKEIPLEKDGNISYQYLLKDSTEKVAGFNNLEQGFDSLKIRLWYGYALSKEEQIIEIERKNSKWNATLYNLIKKPFRDTDSLIISKEIIEVEPVSGWSSFIKKIYELNILTLPSDQSLDGYQILMDSSGVAVQIATRYNYRIYFYNAPLLNKDIPQAKKMVDIMELLEHELGFKRIRKF